MNMNADKLQTGDRVKLNYLPMHATVLTPGIWTSRIQWDSGLIDNEFNRSLTKIENEKANTTPTALPCRMHGRA